MLSRKVCFYQILSNEKLKKQAHKASLGPVVIDITAEHDLNVAAQQATWGTQPDGTHVCKSVTECTGIGEQLDAKKCCMASQKPWAWPTPRFYVSGPDKFDISFVCIHKYT